MIMVHHYITVSNHPLQLQVYLNQLGALLTTVQNVIDNADTYQDALHASDLAESIAVLHNITLALNESLTSNATAELLAVSTHTHCIRNEMVYDPILLSLQHGSRNLSCRRMTQTHFCRASRRCSLRCAPILESVCLLLLSACMSLSASSQCIQCMRWSDRFVVVTNASELNAVGLCLREWSMYYSGLVFDYTYDAENSTTGADGENTTAAIDNKLIAYSIRMSPELVRSCTTHCLCVGATVCSTRVQVDGTGGVVDSPWKESPRNRFPVDVKYIAFGFSFLQDNVERTLVDLITGADNDGANDAKKLGVYAQQFPTQCSSTDR